MSQKLFINEFDDINRIPSEGIKKIIFEEAIVLAQEKEIDIAKAVVKIGKQRGYNFSYEDVYEILWPTD